MTGRLLWEATTDLADLRLVKNGYRSMTEYAGLSLNPSQVLDNLYRVRRVARRVGAAGILIFLTSQGALCRAAETSEQDDGSFLPLASLKLEVDASDTERVTSRIGEFAASHRMTISEAPFPKNGRTIVNEKLERADGVFILAGNFRGVGSFSFSIYSHKMSNDWHSDWAALVQTLKIEFGKSGRISE